MTDTRFHFKHNSAGATLQLVEQTKSFFRTKEKPLPYNDWVTGAPENSIGALARIDDAFQTQVTDESVIRGLDATPNVEILQDKETIFIPHHLIAGFTHEQARSLGLPASIPHTLRVAQNGPLTDDATKLSSTWTEGNGRQVRLKRTGAFAQVGDTLYRIPHTLYNTVSAVDEFNNETSPDINTRLTHLAHLKSVAEDETSGVVFEKRINDTKFSHATTFSLKKSEDGSKFDFDPVLHGKEDANGNRKKLLSAAEQSAFARCGFKKWLGAVASYFISNDHYLFVDPKLLPALDVVRNVQQADVATKQEFLRNPPGFIRTTLEDNGVISDDENYAIDELFTETESYSERVIEIGLWEPPSISDFEGSGTTWIPEGVEPAPEDNEKPQEEQGNTEEEPANPSFIPKTIDNLDDAVTAPYKPAASTEEDFTGLEIPAGLTSTLREHQVLGLLWLQRCWKKGMPGALLADDMGVGKTIQTVTFLRWLIDIGETTEHGQIMVVAPVSLLDNWQDEIRTHLDSQGLGTLALLYGTGLKSFRTSNTKDIKSASSELDLISIQRFSILLTTYETLRDYSISLGQLKLCCVVFDEMQKVKNPVSIMTKASKAVNAKFSLGLTGTPIENSTADLWCIMDTLLPGHLGLRSDFLSKYGPGTDNDTLMELGVKLLEDNAGTPPPILRRMKSDIGADLPPKTIERLPYPMPDHQQNSYDHLLATTSIHGAGSALALIQKMRSISLHPDSLADSVSESGDQDYVARSGRMLAAFSALDDIHKKGEKALIFVESLDVAAHIALLIRRRYKLPHTPARIYGATPATKRQAIVNSFSKQPSGVFDVLVLSPKAAGVGLNIVAANHVIHLTRWWNPAIEDQCTDRAYRIKQDKPVTVYIPQSIHRAYPEESFDEKLDALLEKKRNVSNNLFTGCESGTEAKQLAEQLLAATKEVGSRKSPHAAQSADEKIRPAELANGWATALEYTTYPTELEHLRLSGVPAPEVGIDILNSTDEVVANLEWAWIDHKVGLADRQEQTEQQHKDSIEKLQAIGWRLEFGAQDNSLKKMNGWLSGK